MDNFFKYLNHSEEDEKWGLYLNVAGNASIERGKEYPPIGHPKNYNFNWEKGRILHEYQINYITEGEGIIETETEKIKISEGSVIMIKPNIWHRYKPLKEIGWKEHYIGFNGDYVQNIFKNNSQFFKSPVIKIGFNEKIIQAYFEIFNLVKNEKPAYQQVCAGLVINILGLIIAAKKNENFAENKIESTIQKACLLIRENTNRNIEIEEIAKKLNTSYSVFRKAFKQYTGSSPTQYHLSLRIQEAINLLTNTDMSVKEISFQLGFCSIYYFSKLFKDKTNKSPSEYSKFVRK